MQVTETIGLPDAAFAGLRSCARTAKLLREGRVQETMTTSDVAYMADVIDRGVKAGYLDEQVPVTYPVLGWRRDSATFEAARDYDINAARTIPAVAQNASYEVEDPIFASKTFYMRKYGIIYQVSWEAWLRDQRDLGLIAEYPRTWGLAARYTCEQAWTASWANSADLFTLHTNQWDATDFGATSPVLSAESLALGIAQIRSGYTDASGNIIPYMGPLYLVVPPQLEFTARALVNSTLVVGGSTTVPASNPLYGVASVVVNHFLPVVDTTYGDTGWYLFCAPSVRPAVRYGFLRGYEEPDVFIRDSDARLLVGGEDDPFAGSFETDTISFKLRFTFGTGIVDPNGVFMSTGVAGGT